MSGASNIVLQGRWRFVSRIGRGGDGTVYLAHDQQTDQKVAIKVYDSMVGADVEAIRAKLDEEAAISQATRSPFLVQVIKYGIAKTAGGHNAGYMVMEYLEGRTLRAELERR